MKSIILIFIIFFLFSFSNSSFAQQYHIRRHPQIYHGGNFEIPEYWPGKFPDENLVLKKMLGIYTLNDFKITKNKINFTFVGLGDSYGAGQGTPNNWNRDKKLISPWIPYLDESSRQPQWEDIQCKRSKGSSFFKVYQKLKELSKTDNLKNYTWNINFKNYACSGATTNDFFEDREGVGRKYDIYGTVSDPPVIKAQLDALITDYGNSKIDAVVMSIGGNDVGFAPSIILSALGNIDLQLSGGNELFNAGVVSTVTNESVVQQCNDIVSSPNSPDFWINYALSLFSLYPDLNPTHFVERPAREITCRSLIRILNWVMYNKLSEGLKNNGFERLMGQYQKINNTLRGITDNIFIMEYLNPFWIKKRNQYKICNPIFGIGQRDVLFGGIGAVSKREFKWIHKKLYNPLIDTIKNTEQRFNWNVIVLSDNRDHGICSDKSFFNLNIDSLENQGADILPPIPLSGGMVHPNNNGYKYMADKLYRSIKQVMLKKLEFTDNDYPTNSHFSIINNKWTFYWSDNSNKESKYIVELSHHIYHDNNSMKMKYVVDHDNNHLTLSVNQINDIKSVFNNVFAYRIGMCKHDDNSCSDPIYTDYKRVGFGKLNFPNNLSCIMKTEIYTGVVGFAYDDNQQNEIGQIIAWAEIDKNITNDSLNDYLKENKFLFVSNHGSSSGNFPSRSDVIPVNIEWNRYYSDNNDGVASFLPSGVDLHDYHQSKDRKFVASIKLCNYTGCSRWSKPVLLQMPRRPEDLVPR